MRYNILWSTKFFKGAIYMSLIPFDKELKRNIRLTIIAGAASTIIFNLTIPFFSLFVIRLGGSDYHVAWLNALPGLAAVLALIPGGAFVDKFAYKKNITCTLLAANRFFYLCLALVPFLPQIWQATFFVLFVGMMRFPGSVGDIAWQSFFADYIPEIHRGNVLAQKQRLATFFGLVVTFIAGQILSRFPKTDIDRIHFYQAFFLVAFIFGCIEIYTHMRIREPDYSKETSDEETQEQILLNKSSLKERFKNLRRTLKTSPQAKRFIIFATCSVIFHFGWQMGWPLFGLYQIKYLNASEAWLATISVIGGLTSALAYTPWSRFADKYGNDITLVITGLGMSLTPVLYAMSPTLPILTLMNTIVGISTAGFLLTLLNMTLLEAPKLQRTLFIACYTTFVNVSAIFAPNIGVFISNLWGIRGALFVTAFFRFLGVISFFIRYRYHSREKQLIASKQRTLAP